MHKLHAKSELPLCEPGQLAIPSPPNQLILFTGLRRSHRDGAGGARYAIFGAALATDEDAIRFDASGSTGARFAVPSRRRLCANKTGVNEEIPQHCVHGPADVLSREPRRMREAPGRTEQYVRLRWGYNKSQVGR